MKPLLTASLSAMIITSATTLFAQQSGTVEYDDKMKFEIHMEGDAAALPPGLPDEHTSRKILYYSPEASLFMNTANDDDAEVAEETEGGKRVLVRMSEPEERTHISFKDNKSIDQREFMSRMFLIESPLDSLSWKLTGNRKEILGYPCLEATCMKDSVLTIAWFTPSIEVPAGPARFTGLPGLILELITNEGKRIITAASVKFGEVTDLIVKPTKGKKMSRKEFNKMVDEKRAEMGEEGGNHVVIKIRQ
jgi:GLPGLI family protein